MTPVSKFDPKLNGLTQKLESIQLELNELGNGFEEVAESTEFDKERIDETQIRLDLIYKLQKKHGVRTIAELIDIQTDIKNKLTGFGDLSGEIERLEKEIDELIVDLRKKAKKLSQNRKSVVPDFEKQIQSMLAELSMKLSLIHI